MKFLKDKENGHLFPYNEEQAARTCFEIVDIYPDLENEDDSQCNEQPVLSIQPAEKPKRPYQRRKLPIVEEENDVGIGAVGLSS